MARYFFKQVCLVLIRKLDLLFQQNIADVSLISKYTGIRLMWFDFS